MCGISGIAGERGAFPTKKEISRLVASIKHRGPDHQGVYHDQRRKVYLGHARLSIQDLSHAGDQPMHSDDGRYTIVFNGEIYNYLELANALEKKLGPIDWIGHSDTEVLLAVIKEYGLHGALSRLDGMYAFALLDKQEDLLHLVGDLYGEKPLYYTLDRGVLIFASDFRYFAESDELDKTLDLDAVRGYLDNKYILAPRTIFKSVKKLEPGQIVTCKLGCTLSLSATRYYSIEATLRSRLSPGDISLNEAEQKIEELLETSISRRLLSDRPIGALLSSGVDSSLICALAAEHKGSALQTYTVAFGEGFNEAEAAADFARRIGVGHETVPIDDYSIESLVNDLPSVYAEPFSDPSQIPTTLISRKIKASLDVVLTGDAADELFGGYRRYFYINRRLETLKKLTLLFKGGENIASLAPLRSFRRWEEIMGILSSQDIKKKYQFFHSLKLSSLLLRDNGGQGGCIRENNTGNLVGRSVIDVFMEVDLNAYLPGDILVKQDRAAMSVALEGRIPFLNRGLVELSQQLPGEYIYNDKEGKLPLKRLLKKKTGLDLHGVRKSGFSVPLVDWFNGDLTGWLQENINLAKKNEMGLYTDGAIDAMYSRFRAKPNEPIAHKLWVIANLEQWLAQYI